MKVKLNVLERVLLLNMLPQKGNLVTVRAVSNTGKMLMITPEEEKRYELKREGGTTHWNDAGMEEKEFEIPPSSIKVIRDRLVELVAQEQLPVISITLCGKFLLGENENPT
jgi:hypothetical protein